METFDEGSFDNCGPVGQGVRRMSGTCTGFSEEDRYTFGVALNGATTQGGSHWVSLPMTFSFDGDETDFKAE